MFHISRRLIVKSIIFSEKRLLSNISRQNELFDMEVKRQKAAIGRVEKIEINFKENESDQKILIMNKDISTPYDCAKHLGQKYVNIAALALVNDQPWDMHRPINSEGSINFLTFESQDPYVLNKAFWRSCSFLLGAMATTAFKENIQIQLHSFPTPQVRSGSFVYDIDLGIDSWSPTTDELRVLSAEMVQFCAGGHKFERLDVDEALAKLIFQDNKYKSSQIPDIAEHSNGIVTVYRVGHHIDISRGPMIANTNILGRCSITSVHQLVPSETLYRFQGIALPKTLLLNHFAYRILEERAKKMNQARIPIESNNYEDNQTALA